MLCGNLRSRGVSGSNAGGWGLKGGGVVMGCHSIVVYHPVDTPTPLFFFFFFYTPAALMLKLLGASPVVRLMLVMLTLVCR